DVSTFSTISTFCGRVPRISRFSRRMASRSASFSSSAGQTCNRSPSASRQMLRPRSPTNKARASAVVPFVVIAMPPPQNVENVGNVENVETSERLPRRGSAIRRLGAHAVGPRQGLQFCGDDLPAFGRGSRFPVEAQALKDPAHLVRVREVLAFNGQAL